MRGRPSQANFRLRRAAAVLRDGGIVAYPTEGVFGLGCDPLNGDAVHRLLTLKQRPAHKGLILIGARFDHLKPFVKRPGKKIRRQLSETWPGPVTWLLPARRNTPFWLRGRHRTLAVRVTDHPLAAALCDTFGGAIVSTSANLAGRPPARTALQARLRCPGADMVLHGRTGGRRGPSEIRDAATGRRVR